MTVFIASPRTTTLPVRLFLYIQDNIDPLVAAVSAALIGLTVVAMLLPSGATAAEGCRAP